MFTGLSTTDYPKEEQPVSSQNHGFVQARLTTLFTTDSRFSTAVELSLDTQPFSDKLSQLGFKTDRELKPDISVYHAEDFGFIDSFEDGEDLLRVPTMPPLAIEILSPTQSESDLVQKFRAYFAMGIRSCWLVLPALKIVTVYKPDGQIKAYDMQDGEVVDDTLELRLKMPDIFYKRQ
jgi:Uma2 family endonuclease